MKSDIMTPCHDKRKDEGWTEQELPEIQCFDSLRGKEKKVFCLVLVNNGKNEGFLKDKKRACVMFTRAIDVQIVVGGGFFGTQEDIDSRRYRKRETFMKTLDQS